MTKSETASSTSATALAAGSVPSQSTVYAVEFDDVHKDFGSNRVLQGVSLKLPAQQTTAVVGASGSGKTTLLQLVNGVHRPAQGRVLVFDELVPETHLETFRRRIGYAVQGAALFPHLTAGANVALLPTLEGWSKPAIVERTTQLLERMELEPDVLDRYPHQLSGGQQQRLGLCRALVLRPRLLLLDEPFSAVDPITRVGIYQVFERAREQDGVSAMLVTHDMREAVRLAQHLVILRDGIVLQAGPTQDVVGNPSDDYVKELVAAQL